MKDKCIWWNKKNFLASSYHEYNGAQLYSVHAFSCHVVYVYDVFTISFILHLLSRYVVQYCEAHPDAATVVETELELSKEMVGLLPLKINRLKARMAANN